MSTRTFFQDLVARGIIYQHTPSLEKQLEKPTTLYLGIDPTGDSLHIGHYLGLTLLKRAHMVGHRVILLAGGGTALIGDPGGKNEERPIIPVETIEANKKKLKVQMATVIGIPPADFQMVDNADWLTQTSIMAFLRDAGKYISIQHMLDKDTVKNRLGTEDSISYAEFSYQLLQAYDYLKLFEKYDCRLQIGGSDQWGNIIQGVELIRKVTGETAHALSHPLICDPKTGRKFGKTEKGASIWLDPTKTHPYHLYQFLVNISDELAPLLLRYFSFKSLETIQDIEKDWVKEQRTLQKSLAHEIVATIHGDDAASAAVRVTGLLFGGSLSDISAHDLEFIKTALPYYRIDADAQLTIEDMALATGLVESKGIARRLTHQGGLRTFDVHDRYTIIQKGKKEYGVVER